MPGDRLYCNWSLIEDLFPPRESPDWIADPLAGNTTSKSHPNMRALDLLGADVSGLDDPLQR